MIQSRPYHPQSQEKVERSRRALRKKIAFDFGHLRKSGVNWAKQLKEDQRLQNEESKEDGIHHVSLAREQEESENNEDGNQYEMMESEEGEKVQIKMLKIVKQKTAVETMETTQKIKTWERA